MSRSEVGVGAARAAHVTLKPLPHGALGHYVGTARFSIIAAQAAASRLFELRNAGANPIILTRLGIKWLQTAAHTAAILDSLDLFKLTGFSAVDTVNTVTLTPSLARAGMAASPGGALIRQVTAAGAAAGMTGGTMTKDAQAINQVLQWLLLAQPTAQVVVPIFEELVDDRFAAYPLVFANNEGFEIENRALLGAAAGSEVVIDYSYAEVPAF